MQVANFRPHLEEFVNLTEDPLENSAHVLLAYEKVNLSIHLNLTGADINKTYITYHVQDINGDKHRVWKNGKNPMETPSPMVENDLLPHGATMKNQPKVVVNIHQIEKRSVDPDTRGK